LIYLFQKKLVRYCIFTLDEPEKPRLDLRERYKTMKVDARDTFNNNISATFAMLDFYPVFKVLEAPTLLSFEGLIPA
tara:strand:+ start:676 stop:906 length:231 start_codon:yes stop_codon:yes gene_type:complete